MGKLPVASGMEGVRAFERLGWGLEHQAGSHLILYRRGYATLSVPNHRELAPGLLRGLIRRSGLTVEEFVSKL